MGVHLPLGRRHPASCHTPANSLHSRPLLHQELARRGTCLSVYVCLYSVCCCNDFRYLKICNTHFHVSCTLCWHFQTNTPYWVTWVRKIMLIISKQNERFFFSFAGIISDNGCSGLRGTWFTIGLRDIKKYSSVDSTTKHGGTRTSIIWSTSF